MINFVANAERAYEVNASNVLYSSYPPTDLEYHQVKTVGPKNIRIGSTGMFSRTKKDQEYLMNNVDEGVY